MKNKKTIIILAVVAVVVIGYVVWKTKKDKDNKTTDDALPENDVKSEIATADMNKLANIIPSPTNGNTRADASKIGTINFDTI
ncbi:MAG TPA: hypothetical protein PLP27_07380 [Crocinitomicaceae bacterium]|nr:hypothetical protein [Crocinitomicaceae bacterium]